LINFIDDYEQHNNVAIPAGIQEEELMVFSTLRSDEWGLCLAILIILGW